MEQYRGTSDIMKREMRSRAGKVRRELSEPLIYRDDHLQVSRDTFLFVSPGNVAYLYRRGEGLVIDQPNPETADECRVYLLGTVFGVVAWLNDLLPLHASCVANGDRAVAFTADSGGGKSTLAAALAGMGYQHVCDDTLVLEPGENRIVGHPDGKPLKLRDDAFDLAAANKEEAIGFLPGKNYASTPNLAAEPVYLTDLVFLEYGHTCELVPIKGVEKALRLPETFYRDSVHLAKRDHGQHARFMRQVTSNIRFWRGIRPKGKRHFDDALQMFCGLFEGRGR